VPYAKHKSMNGLSISRVDGCQFWATFDQNHIQKFGLSVRGCPRRLKMNDSQHLQHHRAAVWNVPANFVGWGQHAVHCSKICANLLSNVLHVVSDKFHVRLLCERICGPTKWYVCLYVMIKTNTALVSALSSKNRPKMIPTLSPTLLLVMNLGCLGITLKQSNSCLSGGLQLHGDQRKHIKFRAFGGAGQTVKCDLPRRLRENVQCKRSDKWCNNSWALHHDNTPAHTSLVVRQFLASINMTVIPHPFLLTGPHPLWFFFLFPKLKLKLKGQHFDSSKEIQA
jgi:hypothetical protein